MLFIIKVTYQMGRLVAKLGGFLDRKGDGEPGVETIWIGLQRLMDFAAGLRYARRGRIS